jgi:hypothetical protein
MGTTMVISWNKDKKVAHIFMSQNKKSVNKHELNIYIQVHVFSNNYTIYEPKNVGDFFVPFKDCYFHPDLLANMAAIGNSCFWLGNF